MDIRDIEKLLAESERQREELRRKLAKTEERFSSLKAKLDDYYRFTASNTVSEKEKLMLEWEDSLRLREKEHETRLMQLEDLENELKKRNQLQDQRSKLLDEREDQLKRREEESWQMLVYKSDEENRRHRGS